MTLSTLLVILAAGLAGLALVGAIRLGRRVRPVQTRGTRQAPTEPAHRPAATTRHLLLPALRHLVQYRRRPPVPVHEGATERWSPLNDIGNQPVAVELADDRDWIGSDWTETGIIGRTHDEVKSIYDRMLAGVASTCTAVQAELDPLWARVDDDTTEWDATGLRALLAAEDALAGAR